MRPISLRRRPPRDPRARLAGLMVLPRTIDKARAMLPGGDPGDYVISPGLSAWLLDSIGIGEAQFVDLVRVAVGEEDVGRLVAARVAPDRREAINTFVQSLCVRDLPSEWRELFVQRHTANDAERVVDVLVADDRRLLAANLGPRSA